MRLTHSLIAAVLLLTALAGCGTKTPLTLPPPAQSRPAATGTPPAAAPAIDNSNKAAEPAK